jgi:TrmH family RNA methyltransferase
MIESTRNARVVRAARLHRARQRRETGRTLLEGPNVISSAIAAGMVPELIFTLEDDDLIDGARSAGSEIVLVAESVMRKLAGTESPRGPVAVATIPAENQLAPIDTIVLCGISDPGNAGTLIRSAAAFNFQVAATSDTVDLWSPKVLRAAVGAHFATGIATATTPEEVAAAGIILVALLPDDDGRGDPEESDRPIGLMVGNEARGLSPRMVAVAASTITVPTSGAVESLNAAVAGSIAMFAIAQGRP